MRPQVCGAPGDADCGADAKCGGALCKTDAKERRCGGPGCKGSLPLSQNASETAEKTESDILDLMHKLRESEIKAITPFTFVTFVFLWLTTFHIRIALFGISSCTYDYSQTLKLFIPKLWDGVGWLILLSVECYHSWPCLKCCLSGLDKRGQRHE